MLQLPLNNKNFHYSWEVDGLSITGLLSIKKDIVKLIQGLDPKAANTKKAVAPYHILEIKGKYYFCIKRFFPWNTIVTPYACYAEVMGSLQRLKTRVYMHYKHEISQMLFAKELPHNTVYSKLNNLLF